VSRVYTPHGFNGIIRNERISSVLLEGDPKAAILRAAIEWNERKQGVGNEDV